ncbi:YIP1 family protein [Methanofollis formosanus]|uniref:YIP1 family protein n=1 Tax=Methanofollis formosanus TaxID=299308 RepID=A0A8G1A204_9EURY|nr:YIP1 family protein [Methanofollis formosanus]QYZ78971.1 YIP1 family protein [Methanofollis formosanus]
MSPDIVEKAKGFIMDPVETFRNTRGDDLGEVLTYFVAILAVNAVLVGIMTMAGFGSSYADIPGMGTVTGIGAGIGAIVGTFIGEIIGLFVIGLIVHVLVALLVGGNGLEATIKALAYASTPGLLFGWIPVLGFLATIWTLVLAVIGIREFHDTTTGKAAVAVVLPMVVLFGLFIVLIVMVAAVAVAGGAMA